METARLDKWEGAIWCVIGVVVNVAANVEWLADTGLFVAMYGAGLFSQGRWRYRPPSSREWLDMAKEIAEMRAVARRAAKHLRELPATSELDDFRIAEALERAATDSPAISRKAE